MKVPFIDLKREAKLLASELLEATKNVLASGNYISGKNVLAFEESFGNYCGVSNAIAVGNGSDGLEFIMRALGIGEGDEVICPANSFIASAWSIIATGATPVFCDVEKDFLISPDSVSQKITSSTKAIMAVHLSGRICEMNSLKKLCEKKNISLIEDSAQAVGARNESGQSSGSIGVAAAFSLHPLKNLAVYGDGGIVTTNSKNLAEKIKLLRNHGLINRDECTSWGFNSRLDELQAAYALIKLKHLESWTKRHVQIATRYSKEIDQLIDKPYIRNNYRDVYHNYIIVVNPLVRDEIMNQLLVEGVDTKVHYPIPLHLQASASKLGYSVGDLPNVELFAKSMISLPIYHSLTELEIDHVIKSVNSIVLKYC